MNDIVVKRVFSIEGVLGAAVYLAIGLAMFLWLGDFTVFTWADPWLYVYGLLWPFILMYHFLKWVIFAVVIVGLVFFGIAITRR